MPTRAVQRCMRGLVCAPVLLKELTGLAWTRINGYEHMMVLLYQGIHTSDLVCRQFRAWPAHDVYVFLVGKHRHQPYRISYYICAECAWLHVLQMYFLPKAHTIVNTPPPWSTHECAHTTALVQTTQSLSRHWYPRSTALVQTPKTLHIKNLDKNPKNSQHSPGPDPQMTLIQCISSLGHLGLKHSSLIQFDDKNRTALSENHEE